MRTHFLTANQRTHLERQLRDTFDVGVFRRTLAVLEAAQGRPIAEIARLLRTSRPSVYAWLEAYHSSHDPRSLIDHRGGNRPTLWTPELQALLADSLQSAPDRWGYAAVEWTIPLLQAHFARFGGICPSATVLREELERQEYSWKRPRRRLDPDPEREKKTPNSCPNPGFGTQLGAALRG